MPIKIANKTINLLDRTSVKIFKIFNYTFQVSTVLLSISILTICFIILLIYVPWLTKLAFSDFIRTMNNTEWNYAKLLFLSPLIKFRILKYNNAYNLTNLIYLLISVFLNILFHMVNIPYLSNIFHALTINVIAVLSPKLSFFLRVILLLIRYSRIIGQNLVILITVLYTQLIMSVVSYNPNEYLSKMVFNPGSCSINNHIEMINTLWDMFIDIKNYANKNKLTERIKNKFKITKMVNYKTHEYKNNNPFHEPLVKKSFAIEGYKIDNNIPHKLHSCNMNIFESAYRQVQSKIDYDDKEMDEFEKFAKKKLDELILPEIDAPTKGVLDYLKGVGSKAAAFYEGYKEFQLFQVIKAKMKMFSKTDEKIYLNWDKIKEKARNVTAPEDRNKLIMGVVCDYLMKIVDKQDWSGPSKNPGQKCKIFSKFMNQVMYDQVVVCADGSAFDSTQHQRILEIVDVYAFKLILENHPELYNIAPKHVFEQLCYMTEFTVNNKYISYKIKGTQMTGRMNTCLGNTLRSWLYVEYIKYKMLSHRSWILLSRIQEMVNGDDQIIFMPKTYYDLYCEVARTHVYAPEDLPIKHGLGQIAKMFDLYPSITGAEFLSCILLYDPLKNEFLMVRKLERFLQLTPYTYNNRFTKYKKFRQYNGFLARAEALNILSGQVPTIFKKYALKMLEIANEEISLFETQANVMKQYNKVLDLMNRYKNHYQGLSYGESFDKIYEGWLEYQYGIDQDDIKEYYEVLDKITPQNFLEKHQCRLVDKLYKCTHLQYAKTFNEIHKNDSQIFLSEKNNKIIVNEIKKIF